MIKCCIATFNDAQCCLESGHADAHALKDGYGLTTLRWIDPGPKSISKLVKKKSAGQSTRNTLK